MINIFIQHYGAETTLAKKLSAFLEALQLEIGCLGNRSRKTLKNYTCLQHRAGQKASGKDYTTTTSEST
jgi:hypothetical protein